MTTRHNIFILGLFALLFIACKTSQTSMLIADSYDEKTNKTTLMLFPYGNIIFPDKWTKTSYNSSSRQHFFKNSDTTTVAVTKNPKEKYPFYKPTQTDKDFVTEFVKWDSEYWQKQGLTVKTINDNSDSGYIVWQAVREDSISVNTFFLFGSKSGFAYNFSGTSTTWTDKKVEEFLINLFNTN